MRGYPTTQHRSASSNQSISKHCCCLAQSAVATAEAKAAEGGLAAAEVKAAEGSSGSVWLPSTQQRQGPAQRRNNVRTLLSNLPAAFKVACVLHLCRLHTACMMSRVTCNGQMPAVFCLQPAAIEKKPATVKSAVNDHSEAHPHPHPHSHPHPHPHHVHACRHACVHTCTHSCAPTRVAGLHGAVLGWQEAPRCHCDCARD